jgi:hypothetical protein
MDVEPNPTLRLNLDDAVRPKKMKSPKNVNNQSGSQDG